jgi:4-amino-4-deoxy-L-arabinose transferase-like glycosyltransferase
LQEPQEARFAEVARQMLGGRPWVVPALPGDAFADKPPLLPWLVALNYRVFGVHDWAARLAAGGAGFVTVLLTWWWGRRLLGPRAGLAGALVLCLSAHFVYLGRLLTTDALLAACVVASWATAHTAIKGSGTFSPRWWLLSALACGLGLLTKGPIALVLVAVPLLAYHLLDRRATPPSRSAWPRRGTRRRRRRSPASSPTSCGGSTSSASRRRSTTRSRSGSSCRACCWACSPGRCSSPDWCAPSSAKVAPPLAAPPAWGPSS